MREAVKDLDLAEGHAIIGRFITSFSDLDFEVSTFTAKFFRMSEKYEWTDTLIHSIAIGRKCEIIRSFCKDLDAFKDVYLIFGKIDKIASARNIAAHGRLARSRQGQLYLQLQGAEKFLKSEDRRGKILVFDILDQIENISNVIEELKRISIELARMFAAIDQQKGL